MTKGLVTGGHAVVASTVYGRELTAAKTEPKISTYFSLLS